MPGWEENIGWLFRFAGTAPAGGGVPARVGSRFGSPGRWWSCHEAVVAGIVPYGAMGVLSRGSYGVRPEPGERPASRFVLVSVLRGQRPWLSVQSGGWAPKGTDI